MCVCVCVCVCVCCDGISNNIKKSSEKYQSRKKKQSRSKDSWAKGHCVYMLRCSVMSDSLGHHRL